MITRVHQQVAMAGVVAGVLAFSGGCRAPMSEATPVASTLPSPTPDGPIQLAQHQRPAQANAATTELHQPELVALPDPGPFEAAGPQPVNYYVSIAAANHPRILAARARVAAAAHRVPQAQALDDPLVSNNFFPISNQALQTAAGRAGNTLSVSQKYPWPEKRWTRAAVADREAQIAAANLAQVELEIEEAVRLAYYDLWFAVRAIEITGENREIAAELVTLAEARASAGGSQQDVLRAGLQVDALDERMIELRRQKHLAQADLAALVGQPELADVEPIDQLQVAAFSEQLESLLAVAAQCNPRLRELRWAVSRDRQKRELACLGRYPDFTLGAGWQTITESAAVSPVANGHDNVSLMVGVTLPIWRERIDAAIREASAETAASSRELRGASDDVHRQIRRLVARAYAADEQLRLYDERVIPRARRALELAAADYRGQLVDFGELADGFSDLLTFELQAVRAKATLAGTLAELQRAVGCELGLASSDSNP